MLYVCIRGVIDVLISVISSSDSSTSHTQRGDYPLDGKWPRLNYPPKKRQNASSHLTTPVFSSKVMEPLVLDRVKGSTQPINPYSIGFRIGVRTVYAIATLIPRVAPITALRRGY